MSIDEDALKKMLRGVVKEELAKQFQPQKSREDIVKTNVDIICNDGECYSGVIEKMNKTSEVMCADCGLPLGSKAFASQLSNCPNCQGTDTKEIEREE